MADFKDNILGFVPEEDWLSIPFNPTRPNDPIDGLFGDEKTDNLVAKWQSIAAEYQIPMMAQFHGFDTEAQTTFRVPVDTHNIEKGLIKVKINQSERMRALLRSGVRNEDMYQYVIEDGVRLADQVMTRSKVAKNELLATGRVTIRENNLNLTVDYGVDAAQTALELDLSEDANIPLQFQGIVDQALARGVTLTGLVTSRKNLTRMRSNAAVQKAVNGTLSAGAMVSNAQLSAYLETEFGISRVLTNDLTYGADHTIGADGRPVITNKRYFPSETVTFFASNPAGRLGVGLWGDPPEIDSGRFHPGGNSETAPFVYVMQWMETDPAVLWTKASGLFMPVLYSPSSLWIATVTGNSDTLGVLTVTSAAGTASGDTALTVSPAKASGNVYKYKAAAGAAPAVSYGQSVKTWSAWDGSADLTIPTGNYVTVVEADANYRAVSAGSAAVTAKA